MSHFDRPPQARARIVGADGNDMMREWTPPGFVQPAKTPTSIVNLSPGTDGSKHIHEMAEQEIEQMNERRGKKWHRCPLCSTPYSTKDDMQRCASQDYVKVVRNALESVGWYEGELVSFIADNMNPKRRRRINASGVMHDWRMVRSPRGHEDMPLVRWHPMPEMFPGGEVPHDQAWESLLVCVGQENKEGIMTALPWFTRRPGERSL